MTKRCSAVPTTHQRAFLCQTCLQKVLGAQHLTRYAIVDNVSDILRPGRLTLLLGPPGSGKSVLLRTLAGRMHKLPNVKVGSGSSRLLAGCPAGWLLRARTADLASCQEFWEGHACRHTALSSSLRAVPARGAPQAQPSISPSAKAALGPCTGCRSAGRSPTMGTPSTNSSPNAVLPTCLR
jgi:energy-coupling factor transporter ATP-binding protein EcfA2